jgi:tRNA-Thr(GGU) m(6)t(6)A37 methyltransferase TsaA
MNAPLPELTLRPIGVVRSPFGDRLSAPRQPGVEGAAEGTLELFAGGGIEHALEDLDGFSHIWVVFWFHHNARFRAKTQPPRSSRRRGVLATRSPYRPNPIGLSALTLLGIEGRTLRVGNLDMLDGTPILDIKPYLPYADAIVSASSGWLADEAEAEARMAAAPGEPPRDLLPDYAVEVAPLARDQLAFLAERGVEIEEPIVQILRLGPKPRAYRRIRTGPDGSVLAHKAWRIDFSLRGRCIVVQRLRSGYRPSELYREGSQPSAELSLHRQLVARFYDGVQPSWV